MSKFSDLQKQEIANSLEAYFKDKQQSAKATGGDFSQNNLAQIIGVSPSYVSYIFNKQFDKTNTGGTLILTDRIWQVIKDFLGLGDNVWELDNYETIMTSLLDSKIHHYQYIVDGDTGMGKTFTSGVFKKKYPKNTFYIKASPDMSIKQFMLEIAKEVGVPSNHLKGTKYDIRVMICEKLLGMDRAILIFDEMEKTTQNQRLQVIDMIQAMHDYKDLFKTCSIVVMGANGFYDSLVNITGRKNPHAIPQFLSRFDLIMLQSYRQSEARKVCVKYYKIKDKDVVDEMIKTCTDYRQLDRKIQKYLNNMKLNEAA